MAARGTGLPTTEGSAITPLADASRSFGAAEAAMADGLGRRRQSVAVGMQNWLQPQLNPNCKRAGVRGRAKEARSDGPNRSCPPR